MNPANGALPGRVIVGLEALQEWADVIQGATTHASAPSQEPHAGS